MSVRLVRFPLRMDLWFSDCYLFHGTQLDPFGLVLCVFEPLYLLNSSVAQLSGFSDADFGGCRLDRKSTSGTYQFLGTSLVSWSSRKQTSVALSSTEAEYVAAASCCSQILWMKQTCRIMV